MSSAAHVCHAHECGIAVPPRMFMCRRHWFALRKAVRDAIGREYRPGQESDKKPGPRYMAVQQRAIGETAFKPHDESAARVAAPYLRKSEMYRMACIHLGIGDPLDGISENPPVPAEAFPEFLKGLQQAERMILEGLMRKLGPKKLQAGGVTP